MDRKMRLSKNFTVREFVNSNVANRLCIDNTPNDTQMANLKMLVDNIIQPLRDKVGPIRISSGFRCEKLNKAIGGSSRSQHCQGKACDIQFYKNNRMNNKILFDAIIELDLPFDQMINEFDYSWIHISFCNCDKRRGQILEAVKNNITKKTSYIDITNIHKNLKSL